MCNVLEYSTERICKLSDIKKQGTVNLIVVANV